jgi:predicted DCC family thiol-disulfide oxidoreductase YuxK
VNAAATLSGRAGNVGAPLNGRLVVMYDVDCGLCQATARRLRRWDRDGRLEMLSLQDAAASDRPVVAEAARRYPLLDMLHVVDQASGRVDAGGDAALAIAAALPGGRLIRPLRGFPPARWIVGAAYGLVARNRHAIGRRLGLEGPACDTQR